MFGKLSNKAQFKTNMKNLDVKIGSVRLKNPIICGSGEHFIELSGIEKAFDAGAAAVVAKSTNESVAAKEQLEKTDYALLDSNFRKLPWNFKPPRDASLFNRSGLHPQPFANWLSMVSRADKIARKYDSYCIASLIPASLDKLLEHAKAVERAGIRILEVNVGAPHGDEAAEGAILLEKHASQVSEIATAVRATVNIPVWIKITGQSSEIPAIVKAAKDAGAESVTVMGRYMGFIPDIETTKPLLGTHAAYGGPWALPLTCHQLVKTREIIGKNYPLMATNGARDGLDILRFLLAGASAAQMTSAIFTNGYKVISRSLIQIEDYLSVKNYELGDIIGLAADQVGTYAEQENRKEFWREFIPE